MKLMLPLLLFFNGENAFCRYCNVGIIRLFKDFWGISGGIESRFEDLEVWGMCNNMEKGNKRPFKDLESWGMSDGMEKGISEME